jgi:hypothetical protein
MSNVAASATPARGLLRILGLAFGIAAVVGNMVGSRSIQSCWSKLL